MSTEKGKSKLEYWMKVIAIFFSGWIVIWIYRSILTPIFPEIKETLGITSDKQMSLIPMVFYVFYTFMQIPSGLMADKFGRKRIVSIAFCVFAAGMTTISFSSTLTMVLIGAALVGIGQSAYFGCAYSIANTVVEPSKRSFSSAIVNCGCALGTILGLFSSIYFVSEMGIDWRILLRIMAVFAVLVAIVFATQLQNDKPVVSGSKEQHEKVDFLKLIRNSKLIAAFFLYFATCYGYYTIVTWLPAFLREERGIEGSMLGYVASIVAIASIPGALLISKFTDKNKSKKIIILVVLEILSAITLFLAIQSSQIAVLIIALAAYGFIGKMAVDPILVSYIVEATPKAAYGRALAFLNFSGMLGSIISAFTTGAISDSVGTLAIGFYIACVLIVIATIVLIITNVRAANNSSQQPL